MQLLYDLLRLSHLLFFKVVELLELIARSCDGTNLLIAHFDKPVLQAFDARNQIALERVHQFLPFLVEKLSMRLLLRIGYFDHFVCTFGWSVFFYSSSSWEELIYKNFSQ